VAASVSISSGFVDCRAPSPPATPVDVSLQVAASPADVPAGRPLAVRYRWSVGSGFAGFDRSYRAFVHFVTEDGTSLLNDDHVPAPPPLEWAAGGAYEYTRVVFTHRQFPGPLEVRAGLFDPERGARVALRGEDVGQRAYRVGRLVVARGRDPRPVYRRGFHPPEGSPRRPFDVLRWTGPRAVVSFPNPRSEAVLFVRAVTSRSSFPSPPTLRVAVGPAAASRVITDDEPFVVRLPVGPLDLGPDDWIDATLDVDQQFRAPPDVRTLAVCVENVALVPVADLPAVLRSAGAGDPR
jgi:hypothetical protein